MSDERPKVLAGVDPEALRQLVVKWREAARKDARYGAAQALESDREYYGTVNAAFALIACAEELSALLPPASQEPGT